MYYQLFLTFALVLNYADGAPTFCYDGTTQCVAGQKCPDMIYCPLLPYGGGGNNPPPVQPPQSNSDRLTCNGDIFYPILEKSGNLGPTLVSYPLNNWGYHAVPITGYISNVGQTNLFVSSVNPGSNSNGMGLSADPSGQNGIWNGGFLQFDFNAEYALPANKRPNSYYIQLVSDSPSNSFSIYGSNTAGVLGTFLSTSTVGGQSGTLFGYGVYKFVSIIGVTGSIKLNQFRGLCYGVPPSIYPTPINQPVAPPVLPPLPPPAPVGPNNVPTCVKSYVFPGTEGLLDKTITLFSDYALYPLQISGYKLSSSTTGSPIKLISGIRTYIPVGSVRILGLNLVSTQGKLDSTGFLQFDLTPFNPLIVPRPTTLYFDFLSYGTLFYYSFYGTNTKGKLGTLLSNTGSATISLNGQYKYVNLRITTGQVYLSGISISCIPLPPVPVPTQKPISIPPPPPPVFPNVVPTVIPPTPVVTYDCFCPGYNGNPGNQCTFSTDPRILQNCPGSTKCPNCRQYNVQSTIDFKEHKKVKK